MTICFEIIKICKKMVNIKKKFEQENVNFHVRLQNDWVL